MKKLFFIFFLPSIVSAQSDWVNTYQSQGKDHIISVGTDNSNNVYTVGYFDDTIDFDPSTNVLELEAEGGSWDFFIQKNDVNGNLIWVKKIGGSSSDLVRSCHVDDQFIYIAGEYRDTVDFDPNAGVFELINSSISLSRSFLLKLDVDGNFVWAKDFESADGIVRTRDIDSDSQGNVLFVGELWGSVDFDPGPGTNVQASGVGESDAFVCKYDSNGNLIWVNTYGDFADDAAKSLELGDDHNLFVGGQYFGDIDFDLGPGVSNLVSTTQDIFLLKLDSSGAFNWVLSNEGTGTDYLTDMALDGQQNVHLIGTYQNTVDFDPGVGATNLTSNGFNDIFVQKLDSAGQLFWVKTMGGTGIEFGMAIDVDSSGDIVSTGSFQDTVDFDPNAGVLDLICDFEKDLFLQKLDASGNLIWVSHMYSDEFVGGSDLSIDQLGGIVVCGVFRGNTDFDMSNGTNIITGIYDNDAYIFRTNGGMLSSDQIKNQFNLLIYPNPVISNLKFETDLNEEFNLIIYDTDGSIISSYTGLTNSDEVDLSNLSSGLYIVAINNFSGSLIRKIIKN